MLSGFSRAEISHISRAEIFPIYKGCRSPNLRAEISHLTGLRSPNLNGL
jgi:hypothetical protein